MHINRPEVRLPPELSRAPAPARGHHQKQPKLCPQQTFGADAMSDSTQCSTTSHETQFSDNSSLALEDLAPRARPRSPKQFRPGLKTMTSPPGEQHSRRRIRPVSPQRLRRVSSNRTLSAGPPPKPKDKAERLGVKSLQGISSQKAGIAEMRPARRKVRWNNSLSDWERYNASNTRISDLNLEDLQIHGGLPLPREKEEIGEKEVDDETLREHFKNVTEDDLAILESNIERCYSTMKRVSNEVTESKEKVLEAQQENQALRKELASIPVPQRQSVRQSQHQMASLVQLLQQRVAELDDEIRTFDQQRKRIQIETDRMLTMKDNASHRSRSYVPPGAAESNYLANCAYASNQRLKDNAASKLQRQSSTPAAA